MPDVANGNDAPRCIGGHIGRRVELAALIGVDEHQLGVTALQAHRDCLRRECGEQGHVHGAASPYRQQSHHEFGGLAHQRGHRVTGPDVELGQRRGQACRSFPQVAIGQVMSCQVRLNDGETHLVGGVVIAQQSRGTRIRSAEPVDEFFDTYVECGHRILPQNCETGCNVNHLA